jgi:hypothetical protein
LKSTAEGLQKWLETFGEGLFDSKQKDRFKQFIDHIAKEKDSSKIDPEEISEVMSFLKATKTSG